MHKMHHVLRSPWDNHAEDGLAETQEEQWVEIAAAILEVIEVVQAEDAGGLEADSDIVWIQEYLGLGSYTSRTCWWTGSEDEQEETIKEVAELVQMPLPLAEIRISRW